MLMNSQRPAMLFLRRLVEETNDLSGDVLASGLLVVHYTSRGGENDVTELTRWQQLDDPLLELTEADVVSWGDDTGLVETVHDVRYRETTKKECANLPAVQLDDNLAGSVVVDLLKLANVSCTKKISGMLRKIKRVKSKESQKTCKILAIYLSAT